MPEIQQIPLLPKPPRTWITLIIGAVLVLSGGVIGAGGTVLIVQNRLQQPQLQPNHFSQRLAERMTRDLELTDEQRSAIHTIFEQHQTELRTLRTTLNDQVNQSFANMQAEVKAILTPEQSELWSKRVQRFNSRGERRYPPGDGPRHNGPPPPHDGAPLHNGDRPPPDHGPPPPDGFDRLMDQGGRFNGPPPLRGGRDQFRPPPQGGPRDQFGPPPEGGRRGQFGPPPEAGRRGEFGPPPEGGFRNNQRPPQHDRRFEEGRRPQEGGFGKEGGRRQEEEFGVPQGFPPPPPRAPPNESVSSESARPFDNPGNF